MNQEQMDLIPVGSRWLHYLNRLPVEVTDYAFDMVSRKQLILFRYVDPVSTTFAVPAEHWEDEKGNDGQGKVLRRFERVDGSP